MIEYKGQIKGMELSHTTKYNNRAKDPTKKKKKSYDDIFTFDIETTSAFINERGNVMRYHRGYSASYWNEHTQKVGLCYIWQFGVNDTVYYGRELSEFATLLSDLPKDGKIIIWVHNLSWECHFLMNISDHIQFFARAPHKPMYMIMQEWPNIEFRCSYFLTRLSLAKWGEQLGVKKLVGDLEYNKIRTPKTPLTEKEMSYAERDCIVVYHGIKDYLKKYETLQNIPLTQTGTVRKEVKDILTSDKAYVKKMKKLVPRTVNEYKMLMDTFAGGFTHANRAHAGVVQTDGTHRDFTSHYPTMMIAFKYPMSPWYYTGRMMPDEKYFDDFAFIIKARFTNIRAKKCNTYIQIAKCTSIKMLKDKNGDQMPMNDNGRLINAAYCEITITEIDYLIIKEYYTWDEMDTAGIYKSKKDYLPTPFVEYIVKLFEDKTLYDGVDEEIYMWSKARLNALFGMCVTALMQADVLFDDDTKLWDLDTLPVEKVQARLDELRRWFPWEKRYFLNYSWGIYITAYARYCLLVKCILPNDYNVLYADTDSIFMLGDADFSYYDTWIDEKLNSALDHHGIDRARIHPITPKGKQKHLGHFEKEPDFSEFITLGAKRYCERQKQSGQLRLTVSGINKDAVYCLHDDIENFRDGFVFDKDFPTVSKKISTYNMEQPTVKFPDGYVSKYKCGINLMPTGYKMSMTGEYKDLIGYMKDLEGIAADVPQEQMQIHMRGKING